MELNKAFMLFLSEKEASCSRQTFLYYEGNLQRFILFVEDSLNSSADVLPVDVLNKSLLVSYVAHLRKKVSFSGNPAVHCDRKLKATSICTYMRAVKVFVRWCCNEGYLSSDVSERLKLPRVDPDQIVPLYAYEVAQIDARFNSKCETGLRNLCIVHLMLDAGLRSSEVVKLRICDVSFDRNMLYIHGKGSKYRVVPLCQRLKKLLYRYSLLYRDFSPDITRNEKPLLVSVSQEQPITTNTIKQLFRRLKKSAEIPRLHPHLLRHTFATSYIMGGGNLEFLRIMLGHSDYTITKNYIHLANQFQIMGAAIYQLDPIFFKHIY